MLKIWHISDTHGFHDQIKVPRDIDMVIHTGDCSNHRSSVRNVKEVRNFLEWYSKLPIKYKIYIAGNHDTSIEAGYVTKKHFDSVNVIYLENESVEIEGIKIWGSPVTPMFHNWSFMKERSEIGKVWAQIPLDTDIIAVHGPPKSILDIGYNYTQSCIEYCGCKELLNKCLEIKPKYVLFGHIHNNGEIINAGQFIPAGSNTLYSNGTAVTDRKFNEGITYHGFTFQI